jgi:hypothetical protein
MKRLTIILCGITLIFATVGPASSAVIGFDDIGTANTEWVPGAPDGYKGFLWEYILDFDGSVDGDVQAVKDSQISSWYSIAWSYPSPHYGVCLRGELNRNILRIRSADGAKFNFVTGKFRGIGYSNCGATSLVLKGYKDGSTVTHTYSTLPSGSWATVTYGDLTDLTKLEISGERSSGCNSMWSVDDIELVPADPPFGDELGVDFDGDGKADNAIYRSASGVWWIIPSSTGMPYALGFGGHSSDIAVPGDYDGDGEADIAIYRAASGIWWIRPSTTGTPYAVGFGGHPSDIPAPGDYDGDGEADIAIYRAASGVWWIYPSMTGTPYAVGFGGHSSDIPAPGDYDADGEADIAIYRTASGVASGVWWITPSSTGTPYSVGFGGHPSDIPVPGDYDGDGEADIAIYRAASGVWWIRPSTTGTPYAVSFGGHPSDMPVNPACIYLY